MDIILTHYPILDRLVYWCDYNDLVTISGLNSKIQLKLESYLDAKIINLFFPNGLKKFDMTNIYRYNKILCVGRSGKSKLLMDYISSCQMTNMSLILVSAKPFIYESRFPSLKIVNYYSRKLFDDIPYPRRYEKNFILDECFDNTPIPTDLIETSLYTFITLTSDHKISPHALKINNLIFIAKENNLNQRKKIYRQFAEIFPTFEIFDRICKIVTKIPYSFLIIENDVYSDKLEDRIYYYQPKWHNKFNR